MLEGETDSAVVWPQFEFDLKCEKCGYNLRGLTPPGRCPECGRDLLRSYAAWYRRTQPEPPPDPKWVRQVREGAWLSIATFVLMLLTASVVDRDPEWWRLRFRNAPIGETPARVCVLGIACAWWVLAWAAVWKVTTLERPRGQGRVRAGVAQAARWLTTAHMLLPFFWGVANYRQAVYVGNGIWLYPIVTAALCGMVGALAATVCLGQALRRIGGWGGRVEAWFLGIIIPVGTILIWPGLGRHEGSTSLWQMFYLPAYPYGPPALHQYVIRYFLPRNLDEPVYWIIIAITLWTLSLPIRLLIRSRATSLARLTWQPA
jgi:hypothetical protein